MTGDLMNDSSRNARLNQVLLAYVEAFQAGQTLDQCQLLAAHPDLHDELKAFFASHDQVERVAAPFRQASRADAEGAAPIRAWGPAHHQLVCTARVSSPRGSTPTL